MDISQLIEILETEDEQAIADIKYNILDSANTKQILKLATHVNELESAVSKYVKNRQPVKDNTIYNLNHVIGFLKDVSDIGCRCAKYNRGSFSAGREHGLGLVRISSSAIDSELWETYRNCECTACGQSFQVVESEAGHGRRSVWSKPTRSLLSSH